MVYIQSTQSLTDECFLHEQGESRKKKRSSEEKEKSTVSFIVLYLDSNKTTIFFTQELAKSEGEGLLNTWGER